MKITPVETDKAPRAIGPYSQAVKGGGFLFLSGQLGMDPATSELVGDDCASQTEQIMRNLKEILKKENLSFEDVVETTIYMTDLSDFQTVNTIYAEALGTHKPARATVQVAALPKKAKIEIRMTAVLP
ncbi:MAG: RidA family protein [Spirochaetales bacterium]|nr:RidA family protein [Spirochaetales bacterium]